MLSSVFVSLLSIAATDAYRTPFNYTSTCLNPQPLSCNLGSTTVDKCCSPQPGGLTLVTQFWSTYTGTSAKLPAKSWGVHGLWPDNCNGTYEQYCSAARNISGPQTIQYLMSHGRSDLLTQMNNVWINQGLTNDDLWAHEFAKHATCTSTFDLDCYAPLYAANTSAAAKANGGAGEGLDVVDYMETTLNYFTSHPTYEWLARAGITPSNTTTYSLSQIQAAIRNATGVNAFVGCNRNAAMNNTRDVFSEMWYYGHVEGRVQDLDFVPVDSNKFGNSTCVSSGITYPLRGKGETKDLITGRVY
ncbi:ribonuclease T2-like protein [Protomyces lactucae-debilis]|uniref:ribonuclease T2 n=1 Tax=Protomyces lactucae-debilis TaxID=2754530 RepID=A0A1Y2F0Z3_PROLT|nr:ribonuclease T2-like protein [Protomyces lactucae-debilis]ORY76635.1 ribonuclease T2-like protein [Protomyces lactucae-debilis]